jgi:hypothetical protein
MTRRTKLVFSLMVLGVLLMAVTHDSHALRLYQRGVQFGEGEDECSALTPEALSWLAGAWESRSGQLVREMQWSKPSGGMVLGFGRSVSQKQTAAFEFMHLGETHGSLQLTVRSAQRPETSFRLTQLDETAATFTAVSANHSLSFPQHITYRLESDATLTVRLDGRLDGQPHCQQVSFKRVKPE